MDTEVQDELIEHPPHWWLRNKFMDSGMRRPKLELLKPKQVHRHVHIGPASFNRDLPEHYTKVYGFQEFNRIIPTDGSPPPERRRIGAGYTPGSSLVRAIAVADLRLIGNLDWNDYAFWAGELASKTTYAQCRFCLHTSYGGPGARHYHKMHGLRPEFNGESCARRLQLAYKKQAKTKLCCVDLQPMTMHMWGLPFCSPSCMKKFMFTTGSTQAHGPLGCWLDKVWDRIAMRVADTHDPIL